MLAGITGAASLLQSSAWIDDPDDRKFIQIILDAADRASELTEKLLTFSRKQTKSFTVFSLHEVINSSLELLERTIDKKVKIQYKPNAQNELLKGRFFSIQNALMNLIINASHAMPEGGSVRITTENTILQDADCRHSPFDLVPGQYIKVIIADNGTGIAPENLERIFEPFFTTKKHGQGFRTGARFCLRNYAEPQRSRYGRECSQKGGRLFCCISPVPMKAGNRQKSVMNRN